MAGTIAYKWDIEQDYIDPMALEKTEVIIHLAGAGIAEERWSAEERRNLQ